MQTRILHTKFWKDDYISSLDLKGKLLFNYLLTNEHNNLIGVYELPDNYISLETGISIKDLRLLKNKFQKDGKFVFFKSWIRIIHHDVYNSFKGKTVEIGKSKELSYVPKEIFDPKSDTSMDTSHSTRKDTSMDTPNNYNNNDSNNNISSSLVLSSSKVNKIPQEDFIKIAEDYKVPISFVMSKYDDLKNYCAQTGKRYKDYVAALRNFVKKDAIELRKEQSGKSKITVVRPDPTWNS